MKRKNKQKHSFDELHFKNRWRQPKYARSSDWTIFGIHKHWFSPYEYDVRFCFFGLECHVWMKRKFIER